MAAVFADPTMMLFLSSIPLGRMAAFPGSPLTPELIAGPGRRRQRLSCGAAPGDGGCAGPHG